MQSMKEAAVSAKAGMEKAKASTQEKVDKMKTRDPAEKEIARERKEVRKEEAEQRKQEATARQAGFAAGGFDRGNRGYTTTTTTGTGYDAVGYDDDVGYSGDTAGYSAIGTQDYQSMNWGKRQTNNASENDPFYGTHD